MVAGSRPDADASSAISSRVRSTVKSIKEVVGDHSESDIYAVLRETNMDPNEAAQKLLNQDPFHEVRRRRDRKKENGSYSNGTDDVKVQKETRTEWKRPDDARVQKEARTEWKRPDDARVQKESRTEWKRPDRLWDRNTRDGRDGYMRTGRGSYSRPTYPGPVREFRVVRDNRIKQTNDEDVRPAGAPSSDLCNGEAALDNVDKSHFICSSKEESTTQKLSPLVTISTHPVADSKGSDQLNSNHVTSLPRKEPQSEICSSADPIHINVGLRRREVGVVGLRKPSAAYDSRNLVSVSNGSKSFASENQRHPWPNSRGNRPAQPLASENGSRSVHLSQHNGKVLQQSVSHQKAQQPNMEWRPKSSQSRANNSLTNQNQTEVATLSESVSKSNVSEDQHVIIPEHLRVPDSEKTSLVFGSFDTVATSKETNNQPSLSDLLEPPCETIKSAIEPTELNEIQLREDSNLQAFSDEGPQNITDSATESVSQYESALPHDLQENPSDIRNFKDYDPHSRYDVEFLSSVGADSVGQDAIVMSTETMSSRPVNTTQILSHPVAVQQQYNDVNNQQQQVPQMYQQVQLSAFPNYVPYRHVFPPVYVPPQMAVQNYPNNPAYPHPTHGNSYLLIPNSGPTQVTAGGLKYGANQYKPVFTGNGYGNYANPSNGYPVTPGVIGPVGTFDDSNRVKFKDNNLYVPSQQVEASDIWVQNPRELPNMPPAPFYNVPAQTPSPHAAAFLPNHNGSASFNAAPQPPHVQYPPLHHTGQPASMTLMPPGPHNMVHQQVPPSGLGPNIGVGVVGPAGAFQQNHQLGPIGWTANF
ncbi:hypothetical protein LUZ61_007892 [Rhynchospora tenuis]|uniref:GBF-interacting protein 1 N-terminal domain-containing protein n=1 Tax=Rhynchospora tenuis TaxID=198213 RepID=A0AAD6EWY0_9POAL|nr:hypothetical protein LUZ61_007892 [Rhynchospora tenuis]